MKRRFTLIFLVLISVTSCVGLTQVTVPQSNINFNGADIETARKVQYTLRKTYFLGIGGMSAKARNTDIIEELMKKADLQTNEVLGYISVSRNVNVDFFGVLVIVKHTASGYVVRPKNGNYKNEQVQESESDEPISIYPDSIYESGTYKRTMESKGGLKAHIELNQKISRVKSVSGFAEIEKEINSKHQNGEISDVDKKDLLRKISGKNLYSKIYNIINSAVTGEEIEKIKNEIMQCQNLTAEQKEKLIAVAGKRL